ncbi:phosphatidate cytidylyltransferase [Uliginosibacterium sp. 31-16]|uniref:phosphatidate cytidylyltransferase n=1 Tax=Uliginosibacterium sp. 31-16 TaxID=3068315 RepID=UPI00273F9894|nr:phosphatidate cytidylyltransferase [Uliginosibacterium sp. 31-16]MDP5240514.1 phosphatidate cytidylyltransferase [Uliginosibacterium sp. 31-16]
MLKQRVVTAVLLGLAILFALFFLSDWAWGSLISLVVVLALHEWCALVKINRIGQTVLSLLCMIPIMYLAVFPPAAESDVLMLIGAGYVLSISFWLLSVPTFLYFHIEPVGWYWRYGVAAILTVPSGIALLELRRADSLLMLAALLLVCVADISAFFVGRSFGKRKLAPEISPGKTWEGVYGAIGGVLLFCVGIWFFVPTIHQSLGLIWVIVLALIYVLVCVMGDLFESLVKREAGVKDSGALLPGHGGVLDRVDAMLAFFPFAGATLLLLQLLA